MSAIVAIGEEQQLAGYTLAGVTALPARDAEEAHAAWEELPSGTALVLLTPASHAVLEDVVKERSLLWVVLPE